MAIEFRCPYCTASIRVGDEAAGKPGRCPRCATRLTVPRPPELPPAEPVAAPTELHPAAVPIVESLIPDDFNAGVAPPPVPGMLPNPEVSMMTTPVARRMRRRGPRGSWLIPLAFGLVLFGGVGWYVWQTLGPKSLAGELIAEKLGDAEIPPVIVPVDHSTMPKRQREPLLESLRAEPIPLLSELMQVQIRGATDALSISINQGPKTVWYRIDPQRHPGLREYATQEAARLDKPRRDAVNAAAAEFMERYAQIVEGKEPESVITPFRDRLALNALVRGLGYHVAAVVDNKQFPCVAEADDGSLYFLLPPDVKSFELAGRKSSDARPVFPGHFTVTVTDPVSSPVESMPEN